MIELVRDAMLYDRYIIFEDRGQKVLLIDTQQNEKDFGGLYLWGMDSVNQSRYDIQDHRLIIIGVDIV
jgi:hypothetical protein